MKKLQSLNKISQKYSLKRKYLRSQVYIFSDFVLLPFLKQKNNDFFFAQILSIKTLPPIRIGSCLLLSKGCIVLFFM
jgi:hypothetical protein